MGCATASRSNTVLSPDSKKKDDISSPSKKDVPPASAAANKEESKGTEPKDKKRRMSDVKPAPAGFKKIDEKSNPLCEEKKETKGVSSIAINPGQFILEKNESIYQNYSLCKKLGEGWALFVF